MLRLILQAICACGYLIGFLYHITDFLKLPVPMVGLAWMMLESCLPPIVPRIVSFWVVYAFLVYQLVSFHDYNACLLEECSTSAVYSYITLICTLIFWFTTSDKSSEYELKAKPKLKDPKIEIKDPKVEAVVEREIFPALKIRVQAARKNHMPIRLNMGDSLQPKWV